MKISPRELREAQIPTKAFGFDRDVVDALLERAADTVEGLIEENRQLFEALERAQNTNTGTPIVQNAEQQPVFDVVEPAQSFDEAITGEPIQAETQSTQVDSALVAANEMSAQIAQKEDLINRTLVLAQKTADETLRTAKEEADELMLKTQASAKELVDQATAEAEHLTGSAREEADLALTLAKDQAQQMVSSARTEATEIVEKAQIQANEMYEAETDKFVDLVERLSTEREQLVSDIELLQNFDSEHRAKLTSIVEEDLTKLKSRETFSFDELPDIPDMPKILEASKNLTVPVGEIVAHSELPKDESDDTVVVEDVIDVEENEIADIELEDMSDSPNSDSTSVVEPAGGASADPFADFVNSQIDTSNITEENTGDEEDIDVVAPAGNSDHEQSDNVSFQPNLSDDKKNKEPIDDDDFFA